MLHPLRLPLLAQPHMLGHALWLVATLFALAAGCTDWRWRRIPNWLTVPGAVLGLALNVGVAGWPGARSSLLGLGLGLVLLLPFVLIRSLGAGDWKLAGALGAFFGPDRLLAVLFGAILIAGMMAVVLVIWKKRVGRTLRNMGRLLRAFFTLHQPGEELSLDDPASLKVPFGVAMAAAAVLYTAGHFAGLL